MQRNMEQMKVYDIVKHVPEGREQGVGRKELARLCGVGDRYMRDMLEMARHDGVPIINLQDGHGYYISYEVDDLKPQYYLTLSRVESQLVFLRHLARLLHAAGIKL